MTGRMWGKTPAEIAVITDREAWGQDRLRNMAPSELGRMYGDQLRPHKPTQDELMNGLRRETAVHRPYHNDMPSLDSGDDANGPVLPVILALVLACWLLVSLGIWIGLQF